VADVRRALVTGATGFIGSALSARLIADGWTVHAIVRATSDRSRLSPEVIAHEHDGDEGALHRIVGSAEPSVVFHLASNFIAEHRTGDVKGLVQSNLTFPTMLADAMAGAGVRALVNTGTAWQHFGGAGYDPVSLYAATKEAFEDVLAYYVSARALRVVTLKLFDTYGPNDMRRKLLRVVREAAVEGRTLEMSEARQAIDLVHVHDVVEAYLAAARRLLGGEVAGHERYGVSSGDPRPLRSVVELYASLLPGPLTVQWGVRPYREREVMTPWRASTPIPGWRPTIALEQGLAAMERER
jgi:nucleoside-diphosphate-sugar epimerase